VCVCVCVREKIRENVFDAMLGKIVFCNRCTCRISYESPHVPILSSKHTMHH
jgi:hypothetical protein